MTGDAEPLVALIHPNMEWRGRRRLSRFWQHHPADTAPTRPVRFSGQEWNGAGTPEIMTGGWVRSSNAATVWSSRSRGRIGNKRHEWSQVLELMHDEIVSMQDYAKPSRAALVTRLRTVLT